MKPIPLPKWGEVRGGVLQHDQTAGEGVLLVLGFRFAEGTPSEGVVGGDLAVHLAVPLEVWVGGVIDQHAPTIVDPDVEVGHQFGI